ncbi:hypothetical protein TcWFU_007864 [Taenia crassiceps]|uniref:Uncharacterized protein n=1 Tax=Taenia crassiceps TaxID=6207 RepID=A0ABR4QM52_9CEST
MTDGSLRPPGKMFVHASTHTTYIMTMQLLVHRLLISLLCIGVVCEDPPTLGIRTSLSTTDVFPQYTKPLTSDATATVAEAAPTSVEVVKNTLAALTGIAKAMTPSTQFLVMNARKPQSPVVSDGFVPPTTLNTTPLLTLNGKDFSMNVVPLTENHLYLTESPPTTQSSDSIGALPKETHQTVFLNPIPFTTSTNDKSFVDRVVKTTTVSSNEGISPKYSTDDTSFTTVNSEDSAKLSGSFGTSPTVSPESVDVLETKKSKLATEKISSTACPKLTSSMDDSTKSTSFTSEGLRSPLVKTGVGTNNDATTGTEIVNLDTSIGYSEAAWEQYQIGSSFQKTVPSHSSSIKVDKTTSTSATKAMDGKISDAITSTNMPSVDYGQVASSDSSAENMLLEEDAQPRQSSETFSEKVTIHSATTKDVSDAADRLNSVKFSTHEGTSSIPSHSTHGSKIMDKDYTTGSMDRNLPEMTTSTGDSMQIPADVANTQELVNYKTTTYSSGKEMITAVVDLGSDQIQTTLKLNSSTATGFQDDDALRAAMGLTTHSPPIEHEAEIMVTLPTGGIPSDLTQVTHISLATNTPLPPDYSINEAVQSAKLLPNGKVSQFTEKNAHVFSSTVPANLPASNGSTIVVSVGRDKPGPTFTDSEEVMNTNWQYSISSAAEIAPEVSQSVSKAYTTQKTESALTHHSFSTPPSENARGSGDEYHLFSNASTDDFFEKHLKSMSSYNPTTLTTTQFEEAKTMQSVHLASPSSSVKEEIDKSTGESLQRPTVTDVSDNFSEDSSTIAEFSTDELHNLDLSEATETSEAEKDQMVSSTTTSAKASKEEDFAVPLDSNQESKSSLNILPKICATSMQPADGEAQRRKISQVYLSRQ